jgi:hypothetical protein
MTSPARPAIIGSALVGAAAISLTAGAPQAAVIHHETTIAGFEAALLTEGLTSRLIDFDSVLVEQDLASGDTFDGLTFTYSSLVGPATSLRIDQQPPPTSTPEFQLGTDYAINGNQLRDGDTITVGFAPSYLFGIVYQTAFTQTSLLDTDFFLTLDGMDYTIETDDFFEISDGGAGGPATNGYFVGVVTDMPFTSIQVSSANGGGNLLQYSHDDIQVGAVPVPATWLLMAAGLGLFGLARARARDGRA